jgi:hypothetical protein
MTPIKIRLAGLASVAQISIIRTLFLEIGAISIIGAIGADRFQGFSPASGFDQGQPF